MARGDTAEHQARSIVAAGHSQAAPHLQAQHKQLNAKRIHLDQQLQLPFKSLYLDQIEWGGFRDDTAFVSLDLGVTSAFNRQLVVNDCHPRFLGSGTPTTNYLVKNAGSTPAQAVLVQGNTVDGRLSTPAGATGAFERSTFGPNTPNTLDYSGVTGPDNMIWQ